MYEVDGITIIVDSDDPWIGVIETVIEEVENGSKDN